MRKRIVELLIFVEKWFLSGWTKHHYYLLGFSKLPGCGKQPGNSNVFTGDVFHSPVN